jgi:hypothetical protein
VDRDQVIDSSIYCNCILVILNDHRKDILFEITNFHDDAGKRGVGIGLVVIHLEYVL